MDLAFLDSSSQVLRISSHQPSTVKLLWEMSNSVPVRLLQMNVVGIVSIPGKLVLIIASK